MPTDKLRMPSYGGQALIEGVLMRGSHYVAAAMRSPDGQIITHLEELPAIYKSKIKTIPFLRGLVILWDSLGLGMRFLTMSANAQTGEEEKIEGPALYLTLAFSLLVGIGIFFLLPTTIGHLVDQWLNWSQLWGNLFEGVVRLLIAIGYIWLIGRLPDIQRVFAYHGAEHKTINAFEAKAELIPSVVQKYSLEHPRCGTSFLLTLIVLSVLVFSPLRGLPFGFRLILQLVLIMPLAGIAYEYIRWIANHLDSKFVRWIIQPNLALQHLTTREPSLEILEVAISAFQKMYSAEQEVDIHAP